jgi:L-alanine-DL-glutamate epimerase-like enolase superfamily enzyme
MTFEDMLLTPSHPFGISYGTSTSSPSILVKLKYKEFVGLGESSPASYHCETVDTVRTLLNVWQKSDILGHDPFSIQETMNRLDKSVAANHSAKAGLEMALHDLCGKIANQPTYKLLGLSGLSQPITDFTIGIDSLEMIEKKTSEAVEAGYKILKIKQGTAYDKEIIGSVRKVAAKIPLRVDANGGWTPKQAIAMSHFLAENNVQFVEQPLPKHSHYEDWKFVREHSAIPIFADESISGAVDVARLAGAIDGVVVKLQKTGGLLEAIKVIHTARAHSLQVMFGCMLESSLGVTAAAQLQSLCDYLDLDGALLLSNDPFQGAQYDDGYLRLSDQPGLGVTAR